MENYVYHISAENNPELFEITNDLPNGAAAPKTIGSLQLIPNEGLLLTMRCYESNPKAVYFKDNDPVYTDSCMEAFIDCYPEMPNYGYLNVEVNANGAVLCGFGTDRYDRKFVTDMGLPQPTAKITYGKENNVDYWQLVCMISFSLLEKLYERPCKFLSGYTMRGNFYKCGNKTDLPHWSSWSPLAVRDFHRPEYFGKLIID